MLFAVIGAILVGLGIILILAHNWANIGRINRLAISVAILAAGQLLSGLVLIYKKQSLGWREASALLHILMLGASTALVSQTYHISDDVAMFLLSWMLLALPLVYIMNSGGVCLFYLIGIACWTFTASAYLEKQIAWVLLLLAVPYIRQQIRLLPKANFTLILSWAMNICFYFCFAGAFDRYIHKYGLLIYSCLFAVNYMIGVLFQENNQQNRLPFKPVGLTGGVVISFLLTMNSFWRHLSSSYTISLVEGLLVAVLMLLVIGGNFMLLRRKNTSLLAFSLAPLIIGTAYIFHTVFPDGVISTLLVNIYLLILSIGVIINASRSNSVAGINMGMLLLAGIIVSRFLDSNFSFVVRGAVFILLGAGFY